MKVKESNVAPRGELQLDTYRLAGYTLQVPCFVCDGGNAYDAELCRHCFAPMALAHQASQQKVQPRMLAALGSSGAGKTVYLGMLMDMLSRGRRGLQLLARGAFSIRLQQSVIASLAACDFPEKTPGEPDRWDWVHCQGRYEKQKPCELIMPDLAGESLAEELDHPHTYPVIQSFLQKCAGALVLIDTTRFASGQGEEDFFTMKLLSYLAELDSGKRGWSKRPLAMVLTKADECPEAFIDPAGFAQRHAGGLWQHCQERFKNWKFFASGVAGTCVWKEEIGVGRTRIPLRIEPRGIVEPFQWLLEQSAKK